MFGKLLVPLIINLAGAIFCLEVFDNIDLHCIHCDSFNDSKCNTSNVNNSIPVRCYDLLEAQNSSTPQIRSFVERAYIAVYNDTISDDFYDDIFYPDIQELSFACISIKLMHKKNRTHSFIKTCARVKNTLDENDICQILIDDQQVYKRRLFVKKCGACKTDACNFALCNKSPSVFSLILIVFISFAFSIL